MPLYETGSFTNNSEITVDTLLKTLQMAIASDGVSDFLLGLKQHNDTADFGAAMLFSRSRSTEGSETIIQNGDELAEVQYLGWDGVDYAQAAALRVEVDGIPGSNNMPGRMIFFTSPISTALPVERLRIAQTGLVTIGTGGTFTLATGSADLAINGELEVNGQSRFDNTMSFQTAPAAGAMFTTDITSSTVLTALDLHLTAQPSAGLSATHSDFTYRDESPSGLVALTFAGISSDVRYARLVANQPASYALHAIRATYGVVSGTTISSGAYNYFGLSIATSNAGANVSAGTHILIDINTGTAPTGYPGSMRHYSIKMSDDAWIIDNAPLWFGSGEDCSIMYTGTNWVFDVALATTAIVFNEAGIDTDIRFEGDTEANLLFLDSTNSAVGIGTNAPGARLELEELKTLTGALGNGLAAGLLMDPGYTGAFTVTRHNYLKCEDVSVAASAVVTDSCLFWVDAAAGTHKMIDAGTTKVSVGVVTQWIKANINGTICFIPSYASKTT